MDSCIEEWISESLKNKALNACFVDCVKFEYENLPNRSPFHEAKKLTQDLRTYDVPIFHFIPAEKSRESLAPFQYKNKNEKLIPDPRFDFSIVTPSQEEWIYPKTRNNGFQNPYTKNLLNFSLPSQKEDNTVLICAGFKALVCFKATVLGSFSVTTDNHRVIVASNAIDFEGSMDSLLENFRSALPQRNRKHINHATVSEIRNCLTR